MDELTISHSTKNGTVITGTARGDGSGEILKANGWRWSSREGFWYVRGSRGHLPRHHTIERTAQALRDAGFVVVVEIDLTPADPAEMERERRERAEQRVERLTAKAQKASQTADAHWAAGRQIADAIPLGQPILVGHHSEGRHRRDISRMHGHSDKAVQAMAAAEELARRAAAAQANTTPVGKVTLGNRIAKLEGDVRKQERALAAVRDPEGPGAQRLRESLDHNRVQLAYDRQQWAERVAAGEFVEYGPQMVKKGDAVRVGGYWARVAKVNKATCSVETGYSWTDRVPWHKIIGHRSAAAGSEQVSA